jgi:hypothetical protein
MKRKGVIVAGMHRSGTSALTRVLGYCGLALPRTLVPPNHGNEAGHWESELVCQLNDRLLARSGLHWISWQPNLIELTSQHDYPRLVAEGSQIILNEFNTKEDIVLKDPRICRLLPFWLDVFLQLEIEPLVALTFRAPTEVGRSLDRRNGILPGYGMLAWLRFVLEAERASRKVPRVVVGFDDLMRDWRKTVRTIDAHAGRQLLLCADGADCEVSRFLSERLRHFNATADQGQAPPWAMQTFAILSRWTEISEAASDLAELDSIRLAFDAAAPMFADLVEPTDTVARLEGELARTQAALTECNAKLNNFVLNVPPGPSGRSD